MRFFVFGPEVSVFTLKNFNYLFDLEMFQSEFPFGYEHYFYYIGRRMGRRAKAALNSHVSILFERGYKIKQFRELHTITDQTSPSKRRLFRTTKQYVDFKTVIVAEVKMNTFSFVYLFYLLWLLQLVVICCPRRCRSSVRAWLRKL